MRERILHNKLLSSYFFVMPRKTQKQQVDLARMGVGASTSTLPSAPRAR